jgi:hypothetical protein
MRFEGEIFVSRVLLPVLLASARVCAGLTQLSAHHLQSPLLPTMSIGSKYYIDSHLHVWSDGQPPYVYAVGHAPPEQLKDRCRPHAGHVAAFHVC